MSLRDVNISFPGVNPLDYLNSDALASHTYLDSTVTKLHVSRNKVIISGNTYETYGYEIPVITGMTHPKKKSSNKPRIRSEEYKFRSINRAKNAIRRSGLGNFGHNDKFVTLTFNNDHDFDITDLSSCLLHYKKFIRKLKKLYPKLKYITVPEFQKRGAVHYHIICNLPHMESAKLERIWGCGFIKILAINDTNGVAVYLSKYLSKRFDDPRKNGHRLYYASKNLIKSRTFYGEKAEQISSALSHSNQMALEYSTSYQTDFNGLVTYKQYNPKQNDH